MQQPCQRPTLLGVGLHKKRERTVLNWSAAFLLLCQTLLPGSQAWAEEPVSREEAYKLVEDLMVEGKYGEYVEVPVKVNGKVMRYELRFFPSTINDEPFDASMLRRNPKEKYYTNLSDRRGQALFGLLSGGGWTFNGGLVDVVAHGDKTTLELFVLKVLKWYNGLFDNYYLDKEMIYDFYLVLRDIQTKKGNILKKWTVGHDEVVFFSPERSSGFLTEKLQGHLTYDPDKNEASAVIKGLKKDFREKIKVQ